MLIFFRFMYAVGGQDGVSCLNIVEKYDPRENRWTRVASMSTRRLGVGVAVLDDGLYAIGGSDGTSPLNTVEKYDPKANRWAQVAPMGTRRKHLGVAVFQDRIYSGRRGCAGMAGAVSKIFAFQPQGPQFNPWLCQDLNICVTLFSA